MKTKTLKPLPGPVKSPELPNPVEESVSAAEHIQRAFVTPPKIRAKRPRVYRVGAFKVPLEKAANMRGNRGKFAKRVKTVLSRTFTTTKRPDLDEVEPPHRQSDQPRRRPVFSRPDRSPMFTRADTDSEDDE